MNNQYTQTGYGIIVALILMFFTCATNQLFAQGPVLSGKITFERKENVHKQFTEENVWTEEYKKRMPKYKTDIFELTFNTRQSLYKLITEDENQMFSWMKIASTNTVRMDYQGKRMSDDKTVYEKNYRVEDSIPSYTWKFMGEYRTIAGYNCRKASTILFDSVYVIAFYTEDIPVSAGPETFTGLPGMTLGIVIPRFNLTYFATKVEPQSISETSFTVEKSKARKINLKDFNEDLKKAVSDWGNYANKVIWRANL